MGNGAALGDVLAPILDSTDDLLLARCRQFGDLPSERPDIEMSLDAAA